MRKKVTVEEKRNDKLDKGYKPRASQIPPEDKPKSPAPKKGDNKKGKNDKKS